MCGIVAIITTDSAPLDPVVNAMTDALTHRGPDDRGVDVAQQAGVALGMRRLSILDLEGGRQPMWDDSRRVCVVFNGEIYNFVELRRELTRFGHRFRTDHSDTEVLVHGFKQWGPGLFSRLNGMFALAIWDVDRQRLVVARDRVGEKPLYIGRVKGGFAVASELKALLRHPTLERTLDLAAIEQFLCFDFILGPRTVFRDVSKLPAGSFAEIGPEGWHAEPYWRLEFEERDMEESEALARFESLIDKSVRTRMVADVPVGLFLSGGLDSTAIGYFMRRHSDDVHAFSIGFEDPRYDESEYSRLAARHLGLTHHVQVVSSRDVTDAVASVPEILDEPMGDPSVLPTYLLSAFARRSVKVALGGDGSDELLMGYRTYQALKLSWAVDAMGGPLGRSVAGVAASAATILAPWAPTIRRFASGLTQPPIRRLMSHRGSFNGNARWVFTPDVRRRLPPSAFDEPQGVLESVLPDGESLANRTIAAYVRGYLQEDVLVKVDRASMAASLEVRTPFLDTELLEFFGQLPTRFKLRGFTRKYLLRRLMEGRIPTALVRRRKQGFGVPLDAWLRDRLAPMVREYLSPARLARAAIFDPPAVGALVEDHLSGRADRGRELWLLLQFELWRDRWLPA